jgi:hypothetical protein
VSEVGLDRIEVISGQKIYFTVPFNKNVKHGILEGHAGKKWAPT